MADYKEGQTATGKKGEKYTFQGGAWHMTSGPSARAGGMSAQAQKFLNELQTQAQSAAETKAQYRSADASIRRLKPGPWRGAFLDAAIPEEGGGLLDRMGAVAIGGPAKLLGAVTDQDVQDFQRLKGLGSARVLEGQIAQKGPQTESDAARLALTEISPYKKPDVNAQIIRSGEAKADRALARAPFYTQWANKFGLNGVNERGQSVEQAFQEQLTRSTSAAPPPAAAPRNDGWSLVGIK